MKHTIIALVEDRPGVLNKIASKWRQRGFNIESLTVGHSETPGLSRMTFVVDATNTDIDQVVKQLDKLIDVIRITDITHEDMVAREMALIKVATTPATRSEIMQIVEIFRADIIDVALDSLIVEVTGAEDKVDAIINLLRHFKVLEIVRTGRVAITRGSSKAFTEIDEEEEIPTFEPARQLR